MTSPSSTTFLAKYSPMLGTGRTWFDDSVAVFDHTPFPSHSYT
ncbi:MAG: hypothetical protein R3F34_11185 [Planctomycetota bacterium]